MTAFVPPPPIRNMTGYARGLGLRFHLAPEIEPYENIIAGGGIYRRLRDLQFLEADPIPHP